MSKKTSPKDTAWPPLEVRALRADVPISNKADHVRFPTLRDALEWTTAATTTTAATVATAATAATAVTAVTPATLTEQHVLHVLRRNGRYRAIEYLCRAYLQFGSEAMAAKDLQRLCDVINKLGKKQTP